jgi:hypothetical protein
MEGQAPRVYTTVREARVAGRKAAAPVRVKTVIAKGI